MEMETGQAARGLSCLERRPAQSDLDRWHQRLLAGRAVGLPGHGNANGCRGGAFRCVQTPCCPPKLELPQQLKRDFFVECVEKPTDNARRSR
jgi:hypothetical protein